MPHHVVVGAGPLGRAVALQLADRGDEVRVVTRSGSAPDHPAITPVAMDAGDADRLAAVAAGAAVIANCANPPYHRWPTDWPPIAASLLAAAERSGAVLATVSNLYPYGAVDRPMTADMPAAPVDAKGRVRARMWADALAAHRSGRVRAVEVRASDYADAGDQSAIARQVPALRRGRTLRVVGDPDQPHSWTSTRDTAATLVAAALDPGAHGRVWHVPSNPPLTQREALTELARTAGLPLPRLSSTGATTLRLIGLFSPTLNELRGTLYQFTSPFVIDDTETRERFGLLPEPWETVLRRVLDEAPAERTSGAGRAA
ncbi:MAG TPA: NAD-dependent epimerase/dehydratase family protein [Pseudonocardia sp.]|nr:NAD-dependent epimerase/dehydratase family protein [Pseudonocardia sp.]